MASAPDLFDQRFKYNPAGVAFNTSVIGKIGGFSSAHSRAAARAVLRHGMHTDCLKDVNQASLVGLHPFFFSFNDAAGSMNDPGARKELLHDTLADAFDAISTLDRLDGGITLMVRCPGYPVEPRFKAVEDVTIDTYISPREVSLNHAGIQEHVALIVQRFATNIVVPHLHRFTKRCFEGGIGTTVQCPLHGRKFSPEGPNHLPPFEEPGIGYVRCRCFPAGTLNRDIAARKPLPASKRVQVPHPVKKEEDDADSDGYPVLDFRLAMPK
ncbi:hypothetical protein F5887DRAFT_1074593 [Amanita rubescens]|nr:hypothetical protein F5887DRAFT_1079957 [Amanita rubescens]KAF8345220.1 hypothetical protein F5887DRAFT_1074593 [Amanita rubescens]